MAVSADIKKKTEQAYKNLDKQKLEVQLLTQPAEPIFRIPSGSFMIDKVLGGGWPLGRICEAIGWEMSGKTSVALHAIKEAQQLGFVTGFIDAEQAFDAQYAFDGIGVNKEAMLLTQPKSGEHALQVVEAMIEEGVTFIVVDSVAALVPQAELDGEIGDSHVGLQARLMGQAMRKLTPLCQRHKATILFLNQIREKIGVMFGDPETTSGGNALKFYASVRIRLQSSKQQKDPKTKEVISNEVIARAIKNKTAPPFRSERFRIRYGTGVDQTYELANLAEELEVVIKKSSWYEYGGENICQGREAFETALDMDDELRGKIDGDVKTKLNA